MDPQLATLFAVVVLSALVPIISGLTRGFVPDPVLLLIGGVVIGPSVLNIARTSDISLLYELGLGFLFLLAGYEIEVDLLRSTAGRLGLISWVISAAMGAMLVTALWAFGVLPLHYAVALGLTTTALGVLMPIMKDAGILSTPLGNMVLGAGALGELLPIIGIAILIGVHSSVLSLLAIGGVGLAAALVMLFHRLTAGSKFGEQVYDKRDTSAQAAVRWALVLLVGLLVVTQRFGLDAVLGAFLAGLVMRRMDPPEKKSGLQDKMFAVGYGFLIPLFFVCSGMNLAVSTLLAQPLALPLVALLLLLVRGGPALLVYAKVLGMRQRIQLALLSATALPVLVALAQAAVRNGAMTAEHAAVLVGGGVISVAVFTMLAELINRPEQGTAKHEAPAPA